MIRSLPKYIKSYIIVSYDKVVMRCEFEEVISLMLPFPFAVRKDVAKFIHLCYYLLYVFIPPQDAFYLLQSHLTELMKNTSKSS